MNAYIPKNRRVYRLDNVIAGVRLINSTFESKAEHQELLLLLRRLAKFEHGPAAIRAFKDGRLTPGALLAAGRAGKLDRADFLAELALDGNLWETLDRLFPMDCPPRTQARRYAVSAQKLARLHGIIGLDEKSTVRDLARADWKRLAAEWPDSPDDYMALRVMVGRALSLLLGDAYHPWRRAVMKKDVFPRKKRTERKVSLGAETFWAIIDLVPEHVQPGLVFMAITGARLGEFLALDRGALDPRAHTVTFTSKKSGTETVHVDPDFWPWVEAAVPAKVGETGHRKPFKQALEALGIERRAYRIHDLRHFFAQTASDAGAPEAQIQAALRHADPTMTRRYSMQTARKEIAGVVAGAIRRKA